MVKRKRNELDEKLEFHRTALSRALKVAKGFERQRMAKRQRDDKSPREKRVRIQQEVEVLKVCHPVNFPEHMLLRFVLALEWGQPNTNLAFYRSLSISTLSRTPTSAPRC